MTAAPADVEALLGILDQEEAICRRLAELADDQYEAVMARDVDLLARIVFEEQRLAVDGEAIEASRRALVESIAGDASATVTAIAQMTDDARSARLIDARGRLLGWAMKTQLAGRRCQAVLRALSDHTTARLQLVGRQRTVYAPSGARLGGAVASALIDRRG